MNKIILIISFTNTVPFIYDYEFYQTDEQLNWILKGVSLVGDSSVSCISYDLENDKFEDNEDYFECFDIARKYMKEKGLIK